MFKFFSPEQIVDSIVVFGVVNPLHVARDRVRRIYLIVDYAITQDG
jgi:hypothetical protein